MATTTYPGVTRGAGGIPQMPAAAPGNTSKILGVSTTSPLVLEWKDDTGGAFSADGDTQITPTTAIVLDHESNNEVALNLAYTTNKGAGDDTGLVINQTDTASPGTSLLLDCQVGGISQFKIGNNLRLYANNYYDINGIRHLIFGGPWVTCDEHFIIHSSHGMTVGTGAVPASGEKVKITAATATDIGLIVKSSDDSAASNLLELQDSGGTAQIYGDVSGNLTITGDLTVGQDMLIQGATHTTESTTVLINDNHLYLNDGYTTAAGQTGGLVVNYLPTATVDTVAAGGFTAGVASTSNPTVITTGSATFSAGDLVQISGANDSGNDGLYEVLSHTGTTLTVNGIGLTATTDDFTQNQFTTDTTVAGDITKVTVSVLRTGTDGVWEQGKGSTSGVTFGNLPTMTTGSNNQLLTDDGAGGIVSESNLTWDGTTLAAAASSPAIKIKDSNSVGAAALGLIEFRDSANTREAYIYREGTSADFVLCFDEQNRGGDLRFVVGALTRCLMDANGNTGWGTGTGAPGAKLHASVATTSDIGLILQTADDSVLSNLLECQDSGGTVDFSISATGVVTSYGPTGYFAHNRTASQRMHLGHTGVVCYLSSVDAYPLEFRAKNSPQLNLDNDGNHYFTSTLDAATGNEVALSLNYTVNKATSGDAIGLDLAPTFTSVPGGSSVHPVQLDLTTRDDGFINFKATADADSTSAISTLTTSGATTHHIQVSINGTKAWIAVSTNAPT